MDNHKLLISKVILVLIVLVSFGTVAGVSGYLLALKNVSPVNDEFSGWQTYNKTGYSYQFKYPKNWDIATWDKSEGITLRPEGELEKEIWLVVMSNPKGLPLEDWLSEPGDTFYETNNDQINQKIEGAYNGSTYIKEKMIVNRTESIDEIMILDGNPYRRSVIIPAGKKVYTFSPAPMEGSQEYDNFNKLLSTFRLIEK